MHHEVLNNWDVQKVRTPNVNIWHKQHKQHKLQTAERLCSLSFAARSWVQQPVMAKKWQENIKIYIMLEQIPWSDEILWNTNESVGNSKYLLKKLNSPWTVQLSLEPRCHLVLCALHALIHWYNALFVTSQFQ